MSATGRGAIRKANDGYATPGWCVERLMERVTLPGGHWLEPCAGYGSIINRIEGQRTDVAWSACEMRAEHEPRLREYGCRAIHIGDFLSIAKAGHTALWPRFDVVITNPPYYFARQFVQACRPLARVVVMLLRVNILGGAKRQPWLSQDMPDLYVLPDRPSFKATGALDTDATEYAWCVWEGAPRTRGYVQILGLTPLAERRKR
jgi:hypothetical protein